MLPQGPDSSETIAKPFGLSLNFLSFCKETCDDLACERRGISGYRLSPPKNESRRYVCVGKLMTTYTTDFVSRVTVASDYGWTRRLRAGYVAKG